MCYNINWSPPTLLFASDNFSSTFPEDLIMESSQESIDSSKCSTDDSKGSSSGLKKSGDKTTARIIMSCLVGFHVKWTTAVEFYQCFGSVFVWSGSLPILIHLGFLSKIYFQLEKKFLFFWTKIAIYLSLCLSLLPVRIIIDFGCSESGEFLWDRMYAPVLLAIVNLNLIVDGQ